MRKKTLESVYCAVELRAQKAPEEFSVHSETHTGDTELYVPGIGLFGAGNRSRMNEAGAVKKFVGHRCSVVDVRGMLLATASKRVQTTERTQTATKEEQLELEDRSCVS